MGPGERDDEADTREAAAGIGDAETVVAYDDAGGVIAARLLWLLRALGREAALLDGTRVSSRPAADGD